MAYVSIITVTLNSADHVGQAADSLLAQHDDDFEWVVVDGVSTDKTIAVVESYRKHLGGRLIVVSERDSGLYDAMNKGIGLANGEIIGILNSDDAYLPGTLAAVRAAFASNDADVVFGDVLIAGPTAPQLLSASLGGIRERMTVPHPGCFVRQSAYRKWGVFDTNYRIAADYDFLLRCYLGGARFVHLAQPVARFTPGGTSSRSLDLAGEMYLIHHRHISTLHALYWLVRRMSKVAFFESRRRLGMALLGHSGYDRLRRWWRGTLAGRLL